MLLAATPRSRRSYRLPTAAAAVLALIMGSLVAIVAPAQAASPDLVVSAVYGGGGNSGATLKNDYIEVFNRGSSAVSTAGWSVQYAASAGSFNGATPLPATSVQPGQYLLVQEAAGAGGTQDLPAPDASGNIAMGGPSGKVAVVRSSAALGCGATAAPCSATQTALIADLVGYGTAATWSEGSPTGNLSNTTAANRDGNGCVDTDNNAEDYTVGATSPRNSSAPTNPCDGGPPSDTRPSVSSTAPATNATNVALDSNLTVTFSEAVTLAAGAVSLSCATSGAHPVTVSGSGTTHTADPADDFATNESCTATVDGDSVTDQDGSPDTMAADYSWSFTTAKPAPSCIDPQVKISAVQGPGAASPVVDTEVTVEAVVTAIKPGLSGFFVQEELADEDGLDTTSEGIFVRAAAPAGVEVGDLVQVTGGVREFTSSTGAGSSQTQISSGVSVLDCGPAAVPPAGVLEFPVTELTDFEHFEGMRVTMPQDLVISEYFNFARFNEVVVGVPPNGRDRFDSPTAVQDPNTAATTALLADYAKRRITIDDSRSTQNSSPPVFPGSVDTPFSLENTFRGGDTLTGVTGVMEHTFGLYRVHPTEDADHKSVNPRPAAPPAVGGNVKVAAFNVLNYFLTLDNGRDDICSPGLDQECRGADNPEELQRQRAKIVSAIAQLDADVVGLMEMENTPGVEPAADLVDGLNAATTPGKYAFVDTGVIGTDAIRLGFLYQPGKVTPVGDFKVLDESVDPRFLDDRNRPALAQTFELAGSTERVTVAVNHLKSKGSACAGDPDLMDGAGNCNLTRTAAAEALADWLATDPTSSGDPDNLIIGDLNSYDHEDPIDALVGAGYTDLAKKFQGEFAYSYVFDGQVGYLDYALASESLLSQVTGAADWHINADEPSILDYDTSFKNPSEDALYEPNAFRSSDHDPVVLGLQLGGCSFTDDTRRKVRRLDGDCSTDTTIGVPSGWTLDGDGHTITAYDGPGEHFRGAVVANEGKVASVVDLTVTGHQLADVCDADGDRLRGILLDGASGVLRGNSVVDLRQEGSGCQEGNGIEVRNAPFAKDGRDVYVAVTGNTVRGYQKGGIVINGSVQALVYGNTVRGLGKVPYIAQNGVQVGFGASALVERNTIADNYYTGTADAESCGVLFYEADKAKQKKNTFSGNQRDVCTVKPPKVKKDR